jgi:tRNA uridine 5-carboxymethylaminomethyl modification enzyme
MKKLMRELGNKSLPPDIDYDKIHNLSKEEKEKLKKYRPSSLAEARQIAGINPTGLQLLSYYC